MSPQVRQARVSSDDRKENQQCCQQSQNRIKQLEQDTQQANAKINQLDATIQELSHKEFGQVYCQKDLSGAGANLLETFSVNFKQPYNKTPIVHIGMTMLDAATPTVRATANVVHVDTSGFSVQCSTWADSVVYSLKVDWVSMAN